MGVPFEDRNISVDKEAKGLFLQQGYEFLPVIEAGNITLLEYSEPLLLEALVREGYL
jgi:hypothetical protein